MDYTDLEHWHFCDNEESANLLLKLVIQGKKRATSSAYAVYQLEDAPLPVVGQRSIITNWQGEPKVLVEVTQVEVLPFSQMTWEKAQLEGEDSTLESWQRKHREFFQDDGAKTGYTFSEDMLIVFEHFRIVEHL